MLQKPSTRVLRTYPERIPTSRSGSNRHAGQGEPHEFFSNSAAASIAYEGFNQVFGLIRRASD